MTGPSQYQRLVPQSGRLVSEVLGLELFMEHQRLRFAMGDAIILDTDELLAAV